jgi:hypothetical protein
MLLLAGGFQEGVKRGKSIWRVKGLRQHLDAQSSRARGGRRQRDEAAVRSARVAQGGRG